MDENVVASDQLTRQVHQTRMICVSKDEEGPLGKLMKPSSISEKVPSFMILLQNVQGEGNVSCYGILVSIYLPIYQ